MWFKYYNINDISVVNNYMWGILPQMEEIYPNLKREILDEIGW
jgi:hypothetical protein